MNQHPTEYKQGVAVSQSSPEMLDSIDAGLLSIIRTYVETGAYREAEIHARKLLEGSASPSNDALILLAESLRRQGRYSEAVCARERIGEAIDPAMAAEIALLDARLMIDAGDYGACIATFTTHFQRPVRFLAELSIHSCLAQCYAFVNDLDKARLCLEWLISESTRLGWLEGAARGAMQLALLDRRDGHWTSAEQRLLQAKALFARLGLFRTYVSAAVNLGLQQLWQGRLVLAEENLAEAARLASEMGDVGVESTARADRGLALTRLGRLEEARAELSRALRLARRQASPRRVAIALEYAGELHLVAREFGPASSTLRRALAIANRIAPQGDIIPEVLRRLAEVALGRGDADGALTLARDAEEKAARLGDRYERATAIRVQAQAQVALGRMQAATDLFRSALAILDELGEIFERDRILRLLGEKPAADTQDSPDTTAPLARAGGARHARSADEGHSDRPADLLRLLRQHGLIGSSLPLLDVMRQAALVAPTQLPVLIQGETGTGKELFAQAVHSMGKKSGSPFVAFNCATCPPDLLDAELFGHSRGAFTGATQSRDGLVRSAQGGTLFLDEIGELREESQARLLRLLDSGEVRPLGTDQSTRVQVRIIAATHADLRERIRLRRFRPDLYFRLAGIRLLLPPLRERPGDLRELVAHFVDAQRKLHPKFAGLSENALRAMEEFHWPGNVRQLRMEIERIAALTPPGVMVKRWTPPDNESDPSSVAPRMRPEEATRILKDRDLLIEMLQQCDGQVAVLTRRLGRSRGQIYRVFKQLGINPSEFRPE